MNLRMRAALPHHHKIALSIDHLAPADVALQYITLLVVVMEMRREAHTRRHAKQEGSPAGLLVPEQFAHVDAGNGGTYPSPVLRANVRQRPQSLPTGHAAHQTALDRGVRRGGWSVLRH